MAQALLSNKPFHSKVLFDFLKSPTFRRALDASSLAKLQAQVDHYKQFSYGGIDSLDFQERAISDACRKPSGLWCGELWTGAGKSIIAARVALKFLARGGKVVFICPNRMGIGGVSDGIIQKFYRTFEHYKAPYRIGDLDSVSILDDVHFFTPHAFVRMFRTADSLFKKIVAESRLLIVDEAHHFPEDHEEDQVIYGKIEKLASRYFTAGGKKVVTLTATHGRHDGKPVFTRQRPDFQITVNEAVQHGWCPEVHGLPVYLEARAPRAARIANEYYLNLGNKQLLLYLRQVAGAMLEIQKANPQQQFCAFVRTVREAHKLQEIWNYEAPHLGFKRVALLVHGIPIPERLLLKKAIQNGEYAGYITCDVGSESIDIPRMETVHLIRRTRSINRIVQSIGRVLRNHPEKRRALIVDYHLSEKKIIRACQGLELYANYVKSAAKRFVSGGPIVPIDGTPNASFEGVSIGEERILVERSLTPGAIEEGKVFGWLTVVRYDDFSNILCRCKCGNEYVSRRDRLLDGSSVSCGCYKHETSKIESGKRFGKLVVKKYEGTLSVHCTCDCGKSTVTTKGNLLGGDTKSCGCIREPFGPIRKGRLFGRLLVLKDHDSSRVECRCECGKTVFLPRAVLRNGREDCGCIKTRRDLHLRSGRRFGRLVVLEDFSHAEVICVCDCGSICSAKRNSLKIGDKKSCGCLIREKVLNEVHKVESHENIQSKIVIHRNLVHLKPGTVFGKLTVIEDRRCDNVRCLCECGRHVTRSRFKLLKHIRNKILSCGCQGRNGKLEKGTVFTRLTVLSDEGA